MPISAHEPTPIAEIAERARRKVHSLGVLVTMLTHDRQIVLANAGWPMRDEQAYMAPLDLAICRHTAAMRRTLVIEDAHCHPLVRGSRAVEESGIGAYLGVPIFIGVGVTAAICAIHERRRQWSDRDIAHIEDAARCAAVALMPDILDLPSTLPVVTPVLHA